MTNTPPSTPLDALKPLAGRALQAALNRALALDPDTRDSLRTLDGRTVALRLASPPLAMQVRVAGDRLEVGPVPDAQEPDLSVRSTIGGLLSQLPFLRNDKATPVGHALQAAPNGNVFVTGGAPAAASIALTMSRIGRGSPLLMK